MSNVQVLISPISEPWSLADSEKRTYRKELVYAGRFVKGSRVIEVDDAMIEHWDRTFSEMQRDGIDVPMPIEHSFDPEKNRGKIVGTEVTSDAKGRKALYVLAQFRDVEAEKLAKTANVSMYIPPQFKAGNGKTYYRPLRHVALTDYPVVPDLEGFQTIAASLIPTREEGDFTMSLQTIAEKMGIPVADKDDATLETAIIAKFDELNAEITKLKAGEDESGDDGADAAPIAAGFIKMQRENRKLRLDKLVGSGHLTPAARKKIEERFLTDGAITLSLRSTEDDGFDGILDTLETNGQVIALSEKTGGQRVPLPDGAKMTPSVLVMDAERRAKEAREGGAKGRR